jgi:hypothetical protein
VYLNKFLRTELIIDFVCRIRNVMKKLEKNWEYQVSIKQQKETARTFGKKA